MKATASNGPELPVVSICCATYNHEKYFVQAMESFLMQKVSFPIEVIIGDDSSTDRTPQIIQDYAVRFPGLVKVITSDANVGVSRNAFRIRAAARGKYIALCEGDDYWTDPHKLQKQVDFLEKNPEFTISGHRVVNVDDSGNLIQKSVCTGEGCPEVVGVEDALGGTPFYMNSWVFRTSALRSIPREKMDLVLRLPAHDDPLLVLMLAQGKGFCFREAMGVYRLRPGSYWSSRSSLNMGFALLQFYYSLPKLLGSGIGCTYRHAITRQIRRSEWYVARIVAFGSDPFATVKLLRMMKDSESIPGGRIPAMLGRVTLQVVARTAMCPRALGGRVLRGLGLRRA